VVVAPGARAPRAWRAPEPESGDGRAGKRALGRYRPAVLTEAHFGVAFRKGAVVAGGPVRNREYVYRWAKHFCVHADIDDPVSVGDVIEVVSRRGSSRQRVTAVGPAKSRAGKPYKVLLVENAPEQDEGS